MGELVEMSSIHIIFTSKFLDTGKFWKVQGVSLSNNFLNLGIDDASNNSEWKCGDKASST